MKLIYQNFDGLDFSINGAFPEDALEVLHTAKEQSKRLHGQCVLTCIGSAQMPSLTIKDWYVGTSNKVESFTTADTYKLDSQLSQLVNAMATYASTNLGFNPTLATSMPTNSSLQSVLAASWHT